MKNYESKNTVNALHQASKYVYFLGEAEGNPKILFLGNSITLHEKAPEIGWYGDWGMAASSAEKDYVHLCIREITKNYPDAAFCVVQGAEWERSYKDCDIGKMFEDARSFHPDIIISCICANVPSDYLEHDSFVEAMHELHQFLGGADTKIFAASSFFNNETKTAAIKDYAEMYGAEFVYVSDIVQDEENLAGAFEHEGVRMHPGDKGMAMIAARIMEKFKSANFAAIENK